MHTVCELLKFWVLINVDYLVLSFDLQSRENVWYVFPLNWGDCVWAKFTDFRMAASGIDDRTKLRLFRFLMGLSPYNAMMRRSVKDRVFCINYFY